LITEIWIGVNGGMSFLLCGNRFGERAGGTCVTLYGKG
jgi:hypothetical protein